MAAPNLDRRRDHPADQERQNLRVGHAAESGISKPPSGGIRHARRDVAGPARSGVPARHRHGILGQSDQPGDRARAPPGIDRHHPASLDAGRPDHLLRRFYTYRYLNPWPRPYQKPHPPCYIVGTGSPETIELAAKLGFGYSSVFVTKQRALELNQNLRGRAAEHGHQSDPSNFRSGVITYVAETKEKAEQEAIEPSLFLRGCAAHDADIPRASRLPLGRRAEKARGAGRQAARRVQLRHHQEFFFVAVGTADQVVEQLEEWAEKEAPTTSTCSAPSATCRTGRWSRT